jgi:hypothetical protein
MYLQKVVSKNLEPDTDPYVRKCLGSAMLVSTGRVQTDDKNRIP